GISSVVVTPSTLIPVASKDMQLFCNVTGIFKSIQWLKDSQLLNTTTTVSMNDTTIEFHPLQVTDDGSYQCVATNIFRSHYSQPYSLIVNYGPVDVTITANNNINIVLICNAMSQPPSVYQWLFNNSVIKEDATLVLPLTTPQGNTYTCVAINPLTNNTLSKSYVIT
ncbi:carcinoembryonic antigen-related cell adhesion molecule 5-like, partial [Clarias magur]